MSDGTKETDRLLDAAEELDGLLDWEKETDGLSDVTGETEVVDGFVDCIEGWYLLNWRGQRNDIVHKSGTLMRTNHIR